LFEDDILIVSDSIAIVDDEPDTVQLFKDILSTNGYNVAGFTNPLLALEDIKENQEEYDLILSDYKMTPIDGCDLAKKIAEVNTTITIIIITAANDIGINPLKLQVYFKTLLMSKLIDIVQKNIPNV
jgi:DNA-binding NtrC family response regulator